MLFLRRFRGEHDGRHCRHYPRGLPLRSGALRSGRRTEQSDLLPLRKLPNGHGSTGCGERDVRRRTVPLYERESTDLRVFPRRTSWIPSGLRESGARSVLCSFMSSPCTKPIHCNRIGRHSSSIRSAGSMSPTNCRDTQARARRMSSSNLWESCSCNLRRRAIQRALSALGLMLGRP